MDKDLSANAGDTGLIPIWKDPTCQGATTPVHTTAKPACALQEEKPRQSEACTPQRGTPTCCNKRKTLEATKTTDPAQPKINK